MPKVVSRADLLTAYRAILFAPGLTPTMKALACAILAHFNEDTGQCDPGVERLAHLLGVKRHTVFRAIKSLIDAGLIQRKSYGGKSHRNSYTFDWRLCARLANGSTRGTVKAVREQSHQGHGEQSHQGHTNEEVDKRVEALRRRGRASGSVARGDRDGDRPDPQGFLVHAVAGGKGASHEDAAQAAVERRRQQRIASLPKHLREIAMLREMADLGDPDAAAAIRAMGER
jgi:hypothetical protein